MIKLYVLIYIAFMMVSCAAGFVLGTERRRIKNDKAIDFDYFNNWIKERYETKEEQLAAFETIYEILRRIR